MQSKCKRGGRQKKLPSKLNHQDRHFSLMAHFFIYLSSYPTFNTFRDKSFLQMMNDVAGENEFK